MYDSIFLLGEFMFKTKLEKDFEEWITLSEVVKGRKIWEGSGKTKSYHYLIANKKNQNNTLSCKELMKHRHLIAKTMAVRWLIVKALPL